jgi:hypothetical protein
MGVTIMKSAVKRFLVLGVATALLVELDPVSLMIGGSPTSDAVARVGRPATPASVAGVARRTTRRTIRRGAYYAALPGGCVTATVYGYAVWSCGGVYYQSSGSGYVIVYF